VRERLDWSRYRSPEGLEENLNRRREEPTGKQSLAQRACLQEKKWNEQMTGERAGGSPGVI